MSIVIKSLRKIYNKTIRPRIPYKIGVYNGVPLYKTKLLDRRDETNPSLEQQLLNGINSVVSESDSVVIVGGGHGLSSVTCAELVGPSGNVITYEAGEEQMKLVQKNIRLNNVDDRVNVKHAVVGSAISTFSSIGDANIINPENLPECNILVLDCEGAEKEILSNLNINPQSIVVETHGFLGSPPEEISKRLHEQGYGIQDREYENVEKGVEILTAYKEGKRS